MEINDIIANGFYLGLRYSELVAMLRNEHDICLTERTLKRILRRMGLSRRNGYSDIANVIRFISGLINGSGQLHGYRWMYYRCRLNGFHVKEEDVRLILAELDPSGVADRRHRRLRRRQYFGRGPNFLWHVDSYDKLKPYGICINGCIDGFSRKIMWVNAYSTSSDPTIIDGYFMHTVEQLKGCPCIVRSDPGTENGVVGSLQQF